jgi:hypothetical protein
MVGGAGSSIWSAHCTVHCTRAGILCSSALDPCNLKWELLSSFFVFPFASSFEKVRSSVLLNFVTFAQFIVSLCAISVDSYDEGIRIKHVDISCPNFLLFCLSAVASCVL